MSENNDGSSQFVVVSKFGGERIHTVPKVEIASSQSTFEHIQQVIESPDTSREDRKDAVINRKALLNSVNEAGIFNRIRPGLYELVRKSSEQNVVANLDGLGTSFETQARREDNWNPEWNGVVETSIDGLQANLQVYTLRDIRNDDQALASRGYDRESYNDLVARANARRGLLLDATAIINVIGEDVQNEQNIQPIRTESTHIVDFGLDKRIQSEAEQRLAVRQILQQIEDSNLDTQDYTISPVVRGLETSYKKMHESVRREVRTRLCIHDTSELMLQASGWIERPEFAGPGHSIGSASNEAVRRKHQLDQELVDTFMNDEMPGLRTSKAWDLLQDANFYYTKMVAEVNMITLSEVGDPTEAISVLSQIDYDRARVSDLSAHDEDIVKRIPKEIVKRLHSTTGFELRDDERQQGLVPTNFQTDSDVARRAAVRKLIVSKLGGDENADRSFVITEKLALSSLETSIFNRTAQSGNDQLAEIIGLRGWRAGREIPGRNRGPSVHENHIDGFGNSWLRNESDHDDPNTPLYADKVRKSISKMKEGGWAYNCSVLVSRYNLLKKLLLDTKPKPGEYDKDFLNQVVVYFNTVDKPKNPQAGEKTGQKRLRALWAQGVYDQALTYAELGWTTTEFLNFERALTREELSETAGTFLRSDQVDEIKRQIDYNKRVSKLAAYRGVISVFKKASGGV